MKAFLLLLLSGPASAVGAQAASPGELGIFTNEEQGYFDGEAGRTPPPWTGDRVEAGERAGLIWNTTGRFGAALTSEPVVASPEG